MRPRPITILCSVLAIMGVAQLVGVILGIPKMPAIASAWGLVANLVFLASIAGLWKMKQWGPFVFLGLIVVNGLLIFAISPSWMLTDPSRPWAFFVLPTIYALVVLPYWRRLTPNHAFDRTPERTAASGESPDGAGQGER